MTDILSFIFSLFAAFFIVEAALYRYVKTKRNGKTGRLNKKIKEYLIIYAVVMLLFTGWLFFFEDRAVFLECRQDTLSCSYFHTTQFNKEMRPAGTYDISRVIHAQVKKHYKRRGASYYTVLLKEEENAFELPPHYGYSGAAQKEAERFNRFLQDKKDLYTYRKADSADAFEETALFVSLLMFLFLEIRLFWDLVEEAVKEYKRAKKRESDRTPDDVIQRNR